ISTPGVIGTFNNDGEGQSYGIETSVSWRAAPNWRLEAIYSYGQVNHQGPILQFEEQNAPRHQAQLRSFLDLTEDLEFNGVLYYVDSMEQDSVPSYLRLDLGVTWHVSHRFEVALWGQNLLDPHHPEA